MGSFSLSHWIIVGIVVLILFGRGRISETMHDFGKGIRAFREGMIDESHAPRLPDDSARLDNTSQNNKTGSTHSD